jgi:hypothetical protein
MKACHACKNELALGREVGRRDECPHCHADLHCCLNCKFYDRAAPKQCREPLAELVREKGKANFCDYFVLADRPAQGAQAAGAEGTRKALDDLFRK